MEDYDEFVQLRLSYLRRKSEEEPRQPPPASSVICFHGQPILPPLLSGEKREEMQRHRDAAQKAAVHTKDNAKMAYVQAMLQSVQLRKTPTLEELLQESEVNLKSLYSHNASGGSLSQGSCFTGIKDSLSPPPERKENDGVSPPPLTSTTYSAIFVSNLTPQQRQQDRCLTNQNISQHGSQPNYLNGVSHQSLSSGYLTYENVGNTTSVFRGIDAGRDGLGSSEDACNVDGFFLHSTSNTIAKMPDIINHPPIDGEELEKSGLETSFSKDFIVVKDISCCSLQEGSVNADGSPVEKFECRHVDSTEGEDYLPVTAAHDLDNDHSLDRSSGFLDNPELSHTLSAHHSPAAELHIQHMPTDAESAEKDVDEVEPYVEPYRLSLQALLKKSQEYRRRQRMLRNQAKNIKIQERTQEQERPKTEEQSLSDKENDEFLHKGNVTAEGKKPKERRVASEDVSLKKSWEHQKQIEGQFFGKNSEPENTHFTGDGNQKENTNMEEETTFKNNKLNISQERPDQISTSPLQQPVQDTLFLSTSPITFHGGLRKYHMIPAPSFCRSPVRFKSKNSIQDGVAVNGSDTPVRNVLVSATINEAQKVKEVDLEHQKEVDPPMVNLVVEGAATRPSGTSSQHIDQLESSLCGLKTVITDLESTLTKNSSNHSQNGNNVENEFRFEGVEQIKIEEQKQVCPSECDQDKLRDDADSNNLERNTEWPRRQLLNDFKSMHEDTGPEQSIRDTDNVPLVEIKETEGGESSELRIHKISTIERAKGHAKFKEGLTKSYGQHEGCGKQQPPAKCILSAAQRLRIPEVFRNAPSETMAPCNLSVLSDTSNHSVDWRNRTTGGDSDCSHLPFLNQSYDVDAPSGLWLVEESDSALRGRLGQQKHLTPESGGDAQGEVSKVKRRLLMHVNEETRGRSADASRGAGSAAKPNSSTPRAAVRWQDGHDSSDRQEQLKQAYAAQVRALQEEHRRQQEELMQALAVRYSLLQSVSFPRSMSSSRLGDMLTFSTLSQPSSALLEHHRPLLAAAAKGFLTRRLLRTERVAQLVRTIRDTQQFLHAIQPSGLGGPDFCNRQDALLQERVTLQLRAARYEVNEIFFSLSAREKMQLISWDRDLARERALKRQSGYTGRPRGKSSLSAATQKSLERKRGIMIQKKAAGRNRGVVAKTGQNIGLSANEPQESKRGQFRANPRRVPKCTHSSRPR